MMEKEIFTVIGIVFTFLSYGVYIFSVFKGQTRPHPFSWFIWGLLTAIAFLAQLSDEAGLGAYITGLSAIITFCIAIISYIRRSNIKITKSDFIAFVVALLAIPLWLITETPLWSVILVTAIDVIGFYPTFRKSWYAPEQEPIFSIALTELKHLFTIFALQNYSVITALFPGVLFIMNMCFIILLSYRRWRLKNV